MQMFHVKKTVYIQSRMLHAHDKFIKHPSKMYHAHEQRKTHKPSGADATCAWKTTLHIRPDAT